MPISLRRMLIRGTGLALGVVLAGDVFMAQADAAEISVPAGRFEFASVPEHVFVAGIAETVQLGIRQVDPVNPWPAGDQTGTTGWTSRFPTRLVQASTGTAVPGFRYDRDTGALHYEGTFTGDVTVRLERADAAIASNEFRIRALTPTFVYGDKAAAINAEHGWSAEACEPPMSFADCRRKFRGGTTDDAPLVVFVTPGSYTGDFWVSSGRRFVYMLGDPTSWPTLTGDSIAVSRYELAQVRNFKLKSTRIGSWFEPQGHAVHAAAVEHRSVLRNQEQLQRHPQPERLDVFPVDDPHVESHEFRDGLAVEYVSRDVSRGPPPLGARYQQHPHSGHARLERHKDDDAKRGDPP